MKLTLKLSLVLCGLLLFVLCGTLWLTYRSELRNLEENRDLQIAAGLRQLARHCAETWGEEREKPCADGLALLIEMAEPGAFSHAALVDTRARVVLHSDFLEGDFSARGSYATDSYVQFAANSPAPQVQKGLVLGRNAVSGAARAYSAPVPPEGARLGTLLAVYDEARLRESLSWVYREARKRLVQAALIGTGLGLLLSAGLVAYLLAPLQPLFLASSRVAEGDFSYRIPVSTRDELGRLAAEFNRMTERLAELDDLKDSFLAKVTHDLRNPLTAMIGHADLLVGGYKGELKSDQTEAVQIIIRNGRALAELINNILDVTQLEAGRMGFAPTILDPRAEVEAVLELLQSRAQEFKVRLETHILPDLLQVYADPEAFRRVLTNLVSNALKFTPEGGTVSVQAYRGKPNEVVFAVSDTGIGIPKGRLPTLFGKFSQVPETRNKVRPSVGTGLGLAITKEIVEGLGGRIWVQSEMFKGTSFSFTLPEKPPQERPAEPSGRIP